MQCFVGIGNKLLSIASDKVAINLRWGRKNIGFHHDFGMIRPVAVPHSISYVAQSALIAIILAELAGTLSH